MKNFPVMLYTFLMCMPHVGSFSCQETILVGISLKLSHRIRNILIFKAKVTHMALKMHKTFLKFLDFSSQIKIFRKGYYRSLPYLFAVVFFFHQSIFPQLACVLAVSFFFSAHSFAQYDRLQQT